MRTRRKKRGLERTKRKYTYGEFLVLYPCCVKSHQEEMMNFLQQVERPDYIGDYEVPSSLNTLTYGQLTDIRTAIDCEDPIAELLHIVIGADYPQIYQFNAVDVFGVANFCKREIERINKIFSSIKVHYSSNEIAAGVKDLDFGPFGVLDWYAKRMGITNQNEVRDIAWVRIYNCMKNDAEQNNYERRLRKQFQDSTKKK